MVYRLTLVIVVGCFAVGFVLLLHFFTPHAQQVSGGFGRSILPDELKKVEVHELNSSAYYIAAITDGKIYLGNSRLPSQVKILENSLWQSVTIDTEGRPIHASVVSIANDRFFLKDLVTYTIYSGSLPDWKVDRIAFDSTFFSEAEPLSEGSVIRRTITDGKYEYILSKETNGHTTSNSSLLQKQIDGLFCTDGMLHLDLPSGRITYVYFYRNEFFCADTSLNLLFRAHTIDTISKARIEVAEVTSDNTIRLSTPPFIVNSKSYVDGNNLYVNSTIASENESPADLRNASVIDVYDLAKGGTYNHSFYLPLFNKKKIRDFAVKGDMLVAIYGRYLVIYTMIE